MLADFQKMTQTRSKSTKKKTPGVKKLPKTPFEKNLKTSSKSVFEVFFEGVVLGGGGGLGVVTWPKIGQNRPKKDPRGHVSKIGNIGERLGAEEA